jgi:hypothetical protein
LAHPLVLSRHLVIHSENIAKHINSINLTATQNWNKPGIDPFILGRMMAYNPYLDGLIRTTLSAIPPRSNSPIWRKRAVEFMVSWRMADVFEAAKAVDAAAHTLMRTPPGPGVGEAQEAFNASMQMLLDRYSIAIPATYFYILAMRETFLVNPVMTWPTPQLLNILNLLEAQTFVLRQNMQAIFMHPFFRPRFPMSWAGIEATFYAYRIPVAMRGYWGIAPFPYFQDGPGIAVPGYYVPPIAPLAPMPGQGLPLYNPAIWPQTTWAPNCDVYINANPMVAPIAPQAIPGMDLPLYGPDQMGPNNQPIQPYNPMGIPAQQDEALEQPELGNPGLPGVPAGGAYGSAPGLGYPPGQYGPGGPAYGNGPNQEGEASPYGPGYGSSPQGPAMAEPNAGMYAPPPPYRNQNAPGYNGGYDLPGNRAGYRGRLQTGAEQILPQQRPPGTYGPQPQTYGGPQFPDPSQESASDPASLKNGGWGSFGKQGTQQAPN